MAKEKKPTELAIDFFMSAHLNYVQAAGKKNNFEATEWGDQSVAMGLTWVCTALRATYMKLEELERQIAQLKRGS